MALFFAAQLFQSRMNVAEQLGVLVEEFLGDGLDAEGFFDLRQRRVCAVIAKQVEETGLRRVAAFALADDIGEAPRRGETRLYTDLAASVSTVAYSILT